MQVYKAVLDGHVEVACKVLFKETAKHTADNLKQFAAEVDIMLQCRHPNIVALIGAWITEDMAFIISELCEGGNLYVALAKENFAEEKSECLWYRRWALAVLHRHSKALRLRALPISNSVCMYVNLRCKSSPVHDTTQLH